MNNPNTYWLAGKIWAHRILAERAAAEARDMASAARAHSNLRKARPRAVAAAVAAAKSRRLATEAAAAFDSLTATVGVSRLRRLARRGLRLTRAASREARAHAASAERAAPFPDLLAASLAAFAA